MHSSKELPSLPIERPHSLISRNISVMGHRTSVRLEPEMWQAIKEIAAFEQCTIHDICSLVALRKRKQTTLTAAIRVFIMLYFWAAATDDGHKKAGHGALQQLIIRTGLNNGRVRNPVLQTEAA